MAGRARARPRARHLRSGLQRELSRQHHAGVERRSGTDGAALHVLVRAKRSNDLWSVRVGLMLADSQFLQSKTAANFINNGISWPEFLGANLPASGPAFPLPAPGIRVRVKPRDDLQF